MNLTNCKFILLSFIWLILKSIKFNDIESIKIYIQVD